MLLKQKYIVFACGKGSVGGFVVKLYFLKYAEFFLVNESVEFIGYLRGYLEKEFV